MSVAGLDSDLPPAERVGAIIVSAGASTRMQGTDKTLADVGGEPLISRTLDVFEECSAVGCIVLIIAEKNLNAIGELNRRKRWRKLADVCVGGERRQDSVRIGLAALPDCDWVVVHDGARPFVTTQIIEEGLRAAAATGAAIAVVPAIDTVKRVTEDGRVTGTLDRRELVMAQTPQCVPPYASGAGTPIPKRVTSTFEDAGRVVTGTLDRVEDETVTSASKLCRAIIEIALNRR